VKIIGHTPGGYLIEASEFELRLLSGGKASGTDGGWREPGRRAAVGTVFNVSDVIEHVNNLRRMRDNAKQAAGYLIALGKHLQTDLPNMVCEPPPPPAPEGDAA